MTIEFKQLFERDYVEFMRDRRRWKSDFDNATIKAKTNVSGIEELV